MTVLRHLLIGSLAVVWSVPGIALVAGDKPGPALTAAPGTLVRWTAPGTTRCSMQGRSWAALQETCYYPIDLLQKPVVIEVTRVISGRRERARVSVGPFPYGTEEIDLPDIPQANPSPEDLERNSREQALLGKVWQRKEGPAQFTLPLGAPVTPLPEGKAFGAKRIFNAKPAAQPHTGSDYATPAGSPVLAAADGTVVVAQDLFFPGNAVFIDHGNGLVTMYFHLAQIAVKAGQVVTKGHTLGTVGSTGRSTGPHLFFAVRWHNARVDPRFLLEAPAKIPSVNEASTPAGRHEGPTSGRVADCLHTDAGCAPSPPRQGLLSELLRLAEGREALRCPSLTRERAGLSTCSGTPIPSARGAFPPVTF